MINHNPSTQFSHWPSPQLLKMLTLEFAGTFGSGMLSFAIGLYILHRTGSALSMGISLITGPLVTMVLTPFVGYVVDTWSHRTTMMLAQVVTSCGLLLFGIVFHLWPAAYYPELIGLIIILQITDNFLSTTLTASLVQLFSPQELQRVNSLNQSIHSLATFLAPIIGAVIFTLVAIDIFAYIEIGFELVALVAIAWLHFAPAATTADDDADTAPETTVWANFKAGLTYLLHQPLILLLALSGAAINFFFAVVNVGMPYVLVQVLHLSDHQYGLTESGFAVGMFLGGLLLAAIKLKRHPVVISYLNIGILAFVVIATGLPVLMHWNAAPATLFYLGVNACIGGLLVFINTPLNTFMQQRIPGNMQGRVFSLEGTISMLLMPLGTLLFGVLFDHVAPTLLFAITGLVLLLFTLAIVTTIGHRRLLEQTENKVAEA